MTKGVSGSNPNNIGAVNGVPAQNPPQAAPNGIAPAQNAGQGAQPQGAQNVGLSDASAKPSLNRRIEKGLIAFQKAESSGAGKLAQAIGQGKIGFSITDPRKEDVAKFGKDAGRELKLDVLTRENGGVGVTFSDVHSATSKVISTTSGALKVVHGKDWGKLNDTTKNIAQTSTALTGIGAVFGGVSVVAGTVKLVRDVVIDSTVEDDRTEVAYIMERFDPETGKVYKRGVAKEDWSEATEDKAALEKLIKFANMDGADRLRTNAQAVGDRISQVKDLAMSSTSFASSVVTMAGQTVPGLGIAVSTIATANSVWNIGKEVVALNNNRRAAEATKDNPVLQALSKHVQQERLYNGRKELLTGVTNAAGLAATVAGAAAFGVGSVVAGAVAGAATVAVSVGVAGFNAVHEKTLKERRAEGDVAFNAVKGQLANMASGDELPELPDLAAKENIGLTERLTLNMLREGDPKGQKDVVKFLRELGVSDATITKLRVQNEATALKTLQSALYKDKLKWKHFDVVGTFQSLGRITGITQLGYKLASLADKLGTKIHNAKEAFIKTDFAINHLSPRITNYDGLHNWKGWGELAPDYPDY